METLSNGTHAGFRYIKVGRIQEYHHCEVHPHWMLGNPPICGNYRSLRESPKLWESSKLRLSAGPSFSNMGTEKQSKMQF